jgi:general secretion pathway protein A
MYNQLYGFKESPFNLTPSSRFFYASEKHMEALSTLIYAIDERKGFVVITGDIGSGKTTVCRTLLNQLNTTTHTALINNTHISSGKELLAMILEDLQVDFIPGAKSKLLSQLNQYLIEQLRNGINVVLIIDEAQNLTPSILEEVRMLSNLETEDEKLIQIIFLGQPELKQKLALKRLEQLRQRIAVFYHLTPLSEEETTAYIRHRILVARNHVCKITEKTVEKDNPGLAEQSQQSGPAIFTPEAVKEIHTFTGGVPRLINQLCDSALLTGFIRGLSSLDAELIREIIRETPTFQILIQRQSDLTTRGEKPGLKLDEKPDENGKNKLNLHVQDIDLSKIPSHWFSLLSEQKQLEE